MNFAVKRCELIILFQILFKYLLKELMEGDDTGNEVCEKK